MTHTPGPWHRYGDGSGIAGPDGQPIAVVAHEGATWEGNARLIVTAAEMAEYIQRYADEDPEARAILQEAGVL